MTANTKGELALRAKGELVRQSLQRGTPVRMVLSTASMSPDLVPGDELIVEAAEWQKLRSGDIVVYERDQMLFAHRLIRVERQNGGVRLITKGDASGSYDAPVLIASYLGRVARVARGGHIINLEGWGARAAARLRVLRSVSSTMITRLTHNIQVRLGIYSVLILALLLFGAATASAAVTISSFTATGGQGKIVLSWTTATELHNWGFNLYRSTDQTNWGNPIAFVQSYSLCNSSVTGNSYNYTDNSSDLVITTTYYYRLQSLGKQCTDSDEYYNRIVSAAPNGAKTPAQPTATPTVLPSATATTQPAATPTAVPPTSTPSNIPQATSTDTPQAQNTPAATNTPPANAPRFTPTATLAGVTRLPTAADAAATPPPAGTEQPTQAITTDTPSADASTASPAQTEVAIVVATDTPSSAGPQGSSRPVQHQPTPAPAAAGSLLVGLGLLGVFGMGAAGFLLLGLAGIVIWRFYARG